MLVIYTSQDYEYWKDDLQKLTEHLKDITFEPCWQLSGKTRTCVKLHGVTKRDYMVMKLESDQPPEHVILHNLMLTALEKMAGDPGSAMTWFCVRTEVVDD